MVTIETAHGTYTGEDMKAATRAAKKGGAVAARLQREKNERYKLALLRAESEAYRLLMRKAEGRFTNWEHNPRGSEWCRVSVENADTTSPHDVVKFDLREATGRAATHNCGHSPMVMGVVCDAGGWSVGVFFKDSAGVVELYAIGANEDTLAFARVPGVTTDDFPARV